ncbi:hypothetical protein QR297_12065 [Pseudomonas shirazica]|uniref:Uncharacterized protein n=1 Tax=Pseudomonas shirazica TaxID=1940636 RepID=A0ABY9SW44_9PSED|nr:hypothetical protein [Pseudomonas shirazica]WMY87535.1 hypothetical protein QR297_12065 [Pseudomonas shirazica]
MTTLIMAPVAFYMVGPDDVSRFFKKRDTSMEAVIRAAEADSINYPIVSSEGTVVKVMHGAVLNGDVPIRDLNFLFTQVSPFRPATMNTTFRGGDRCRFLGKGQGVSDSAKVGYIDIVGISCVDDRGTAFGMFSKNGKRLGFVTNVGDLASTGVKTSSEDGLRVLRQYDNVAIRFDEPIMALVEQGAVR